MKIQNLGKTKQDKGVAGLTIMLSIIVMLFIIGLLVMIFVILGSSMQSATYTKGSSVMVNDTVTVTTSTTAALTAGKYRSGSCGTITLVVNTTDGYPITAANYTQTGCNLVGAQKLAFSPYLNSTATGVTWGVTYPYTFDANNSATDVMEKTNVALGSVSGWMPIIIVISAMIVLILLTVMIIIAIRSSGTMGGAESGGATSAGTEGFA